MVRWRVRKAAPVFAERQSVRDGRVGRSARSFLPGARRLCLFLPPTGELNGEIADAAQVGLAARQVGHLGDVKELICARRPRTRQAGPGEPDASTCFGESVCNTASRWPLPLGTPVTTTCVSVACANSRSDSSTSPCGTISPPVLLNRLSRSVIVSQPSSS